MNYKKSMFNFTIKKIKNEFIVLNTKSGSVCKFDAKTYNNLVNEKFEDEENLSALIKSGFVVDKNLDEMNKTLLEEQTAILDNSPQTLNMVIAPTMKCNLKCIYCFEENCDKNDKFTLSSQEKILHCVEKRIKTNKNLKTVSVRWFGGEPLLEYENIIEFSKKIISLCKEYDINYKAQITTNGVLLTKERATILKNECNIISCQITLDGTKENYCYYKNATAKQFNDVIKNIQDCCDIMSIQIRLNADNNNFEDLKKLTKYLLVDLNLKDKIFIYLAELKCICDNQNYTKEKSLNTQKTANLHTQFINYITDELNIKNIKFPIIRPKTTYCGYMKHYNLVIGPSGELYRCEHLIGQKDKVIGDCQNGLYYNNFEMQEFNFKRPKKCLNCSIFPMCLSGCRDERKHIPITKDFCDDQKQNIIENILLQLNKN